MHSILHARRCKAYFPTCGGYFGWCAPEDDLFFGYDGGVSDIVSTGDGMTTILFFFMLLTEFFSLPPQY